MIFLTMQQIIWVTVSILSNSWCYCQSAFFNLEHENTSIVKTNEVQPLLDEPVDSEMECYMKCVGYQDKCCLIEVQEKSAKVYKCLLYNISLVDVNMVYEKNSKIATVVDRDCNLPKSCLEWYEKGWKEDGVYNICVNRRSTKVLCDMTTNGGGWTLFIRRIDGSVDFNRPWNEYKNGFGDANGEFWLGNDLIHQLTNKVNGTLIKMKTTSFENLNKEIIYQKFKIDGENEKYKVHIGDVVEGDEYLRNNGHKFRYNDGAYFSTFDQDNNALTEVNCPSSYSGGYWYKACSSVFPTSPYGNCPTNKCIVWYGWKSGETFTHLKDIEMSIR